jgi:hypothetical protein
MIVKCLKNKRKKKIQLKYKNKDNNHNFKEIAQIWYFNLTSLLVIFKALSIN